MAIAPTHDSSQMFCFTRATAISRWIRDDAGLVVGADDEAADVRVADPPVDLAAGDDRHFDAVDETDAAAEERNDVLAEAESEGKMSAPSRKNVRFSGKKSGKRVRLVRRVSTSVSAKSVLTVSDAEHVRSELAA